MENIKVLHINTLDSYGGAAQVANDLISSTHTQNSFVVRYKTTGRDHVIAFTKFNLLDVIFLFVDKIRSMIGLRSSIRIKLGLGDALNSTYRKLSKLKEYREADIIHLHNIHGGFFDLNALIKIAKEKKIVWTLHDMWIMTGGEAYTFDNDNYKSGIAETPFSNYYPLSNPYFDRRTFYMKKKKKVYQLIAKSLKVVPVSYWLERSLRQSFVYDNNVEVKTIVNGINLSIFKNADKRQWKKPRILFFNLDSPFKGSYLFLEILKKIQHNFDLLLIGSKIARVEPLLYFDFVKSRTELADIYNQADILVFPSLAECFPLTILEAMACGICVIASDVGGIPEMLKNDYGYLFKSGNADDLLHKVDAALENTDALRQMGKKAEQVALEKFDLSKCARQYEDLYAELIKKTEN
jgi:glycosyltransferase involved in cell wall biosynthesis